MTCIHCHKRIYWNEYLGDYVTKIGTYAKPASLDASVCYENPDPVKLDHEPDTEDAA